MCGELAPVGCAETKCPCLVSGGDGVLRVEYCVGCRTETVRAVPYEPDISGTDVPLNAKWPGCMKE